MKKIYFLLFAVLFTTIANAQLTGVKNIPGAYADLATAIAALNAQGVGAGGVTLNLIAGNPQTAPAGGYVIGGPGSNMLITGTNPSSAGNPVIINGNGNTITASAAQTVGSLNDAVFKLVGADWVTLQTFTIQENPLNVVTVAATNTMTEWGIAMLHNSTTDGCQNNIIQNNTISLNRIYNNTFGIYSNTCHSATVLGVLENITALTGANAPNKVYGNQVSNINFGIIFIGSNTPAFMDNANDIGGLVVGTGNTISNWGGLNATPATYTNLTGNIAGIGMWHEYGYNVSWNSVTSAAVVVTTLTHFGIINNYPVAVPTGTFTNTISNNILTVTVSNTGSTGGITGINNTSTNTAMVPGATVNITNNTITAQLSGTGTTASVQPIGSAFNAGTVNINNNNVLNCSTTAATGTMFGIITFFSSAVLAPGTVNIQSNTVRGFTATSTGATVYMIDQESAASTAVNILNNNVGDATAGALTYTTATTGLIAGIRLINAANTATLNITGNTVRGFSLVTTSGLFNGMFTALNTVAPGNININNNNLGVAVAGGGLVTFSGAQALGIIGISNTVGVAGGTINMNGNSIRGINFLTTPAAVTGISQTFNWGAGTININNNNLGTADNGSTGAFATFTGAQASAVTGISNTAGTGSVFSANGNNFQGFNYVVAGSGSFQLISQSADAGSEAFNNNNFNNLSINTSASVLGFLIACSNATPVVSITGNLITTQFSNSNATAGANFIGIYNQGTPTTGTDNISNNTFLNVTMRASNIGSLIYYTPGSGVTCTHNITANNNSITSMNNLGAGSTYPFNIGGGNVNVVANNTISSITGTGQTIGFLIGAASTNTTTGAVSVNDNLVNNINSSTAGSQAQGMQVAGGPTQNIFRNKIFDINATSTGVVIGLIESDATAGSTTNIYNNFIGRLYAPGSGFFQAVRAITFGTAVANTANLYYNTVYLDGNCPAQSYCVYMPGTVPTYNFIDNIFANNVVSTGGLEQLGIFVTGSLTPSYATTSNYNDIYAGTPGPLHLLYADGAVNALTNKQQTLAAFQAFVTPRESASITQLPVFVGPADLHLSNTPGANWCIDGRGVVVPSVLTDIDGQVRSVGVSPNGPDMGADEFTSTGNAAAVPASQTIDCGASITPITYTGAGTTFNWTRDNTGTVSGTIGASGTGTISGTLVNPTASPITVTFTITPSNAFGCTGPSFTATVTVNPTPNAVATPSSQTICSGAAITTIVLSSTTAGTITYGWTRDNNATVTGIAASGSGNISGTLTNTTNAPVTVTFTITPTSGGCLGTPITATVTVNPTPNAVATPSSQFVCSGTPIATIALTGSVAGTVFNWTRDNTVNTTGIAASGSGNISGTLTNSTGVTQTTTFTITPTANGCPGTPITATVTVYPLAVISETQVEPTTCASSDGSITLTISGAAGPYTFAWTGPGVNPSAQNQTNLTVGSYNVTVTVNATGCQTFATYTLLGPGGCFVCPTIPNLATNPSGTTCTSTNNTITASGLTNMGITYGITFKYSLGSALLNPYTGGTVIATVPNGSLTSGGTVATTNATFATAGTYYIYAILSPTPVDPSCRPSNVVVLTVNNNPTLTLGASPTVCSGSVSAPLPFTSTYTGPNGNTVVNGGFETGGSAPWVVLSAQPAPVISGTVSHSGTYSYALGSFGPGETPGDASVYQTISVPAEGGTLSYWYKPATADNINFDWQDAYITNTSGTILQTLMHVCSNSNVWTQVSVNMSAYAGQTVRIEFLVHGDNAGDPTNMYVDDVVLNGPGGGPATYSITWNAPAPAQGFTNVSNAALPSSPTPITLVIPAAAAPGTYTGTVTVTNSNGCSSTGQPFSVTINPIPVVNQPASQVVCNNTSTSAVNFTTPTTGPGTIVYNWSHSASGIGLANNGTGNIPVFTAINNTSAPVVATITVTPTYTYNGVTCFGQPKQFTITINPTPTVNAVASQTVCHNTATAAVNFTGFVAGTVYNWTNTNTTIGLAASGTGNIGSFTATNAGTTPAVATITVTPSYSNAGVTCTGAPVSFTITVNPRPVINAVGNQTVCNGSATTAVVFTSNTAAGNTTYGWTNSNTAIGLGASGTGNIGSFTATNTTGLPITGTITVTPTYTNNGTSCTGAPVTFTITVNPSPTVNPLPANQILCNGSATTPVAFNGPVSGAFYTWTNNQPGIGLGSVGSSNIPSFIATNAGTAPVVATVTVTGNYTNGGVTCTGPSVSFTYTVNPTPSVNALANQTLCNGTASAAVTLGGPVPGTVFTWTNNNTTIGLGSGGTGNIPGFVATNTTNVPVTATVTVTPVYTANGISCSGTPVSFTITVNPTPQINGTGNQVVCAGSATAPVNFSGSPAGTTYSWTNSNPAIGLPASGTGNIASFTATNGGNAPITGTISVTTSANSCGGGSTSFTITVNPTATVNAVANQTVCNGSNTAAINFGSNVPGAVFTWTNNNTTIGLIASGVGNIPSFTAYNPTTSPVVATITVTATMTNGGVSCSGPSRSFTITVNPGANIIFTNVPIRVCLTDTVVLLTATPSGGVWAGAGVSANTFNAATAGLGVKTISYTVTSSGCSGTRYVDVTVQDCQERHNVLSGALRLYPNPTTGQFNIRFLTDRYKEFNLNVMDAKGMVVKNYSFTGLVYGSVIPMDLSTLPSGYYILEAYNSQERAAFKLIIAH